MLALTISFILFLWLFFDKGKLTPVSLVILSMVQVLIGMRQIDSQNGTSYWLMYAFGILAIELGWYFGAFLNLRKSHIYKFNNHKVVMYTYDKNISAMYFAFVCIAVLEYFLVGGVPILSKNVEVQRFSFSSGGLFGIPGRMYLFGLPFLVIYLQYLAKISPYKNNIFFSRLAWGLYIISRLISGFKGGVVEIFIFWVLVRSSEGNSLSLRKTVSLRGLLGILVSVVFAGAISTRYGSVDVSSFASIKNYLLNRMTVIPAQPVYFALNELGKAKFQPFYFIKGDFIYFTREYFHINLTSGPSYSMDQIVSSALTHTPLGLGKFIVSVTVGIYPEFYLGLGTFFTLVVLFLIGMWFYTTYQSVHLGRGSIFSKASLTLGVWFFFRACVNGDVVYLLINFLAVVAFMKFLEIVSALLSKPEYRGRSANYAESSVIIENKTKDDLPTHLNPTVR